MLGRHKNCLSCHQTKRRISSVLQNKIARAKYKKDKELKQLQQLEEAAEQKQIATELSAAEYHGETAVGSKKDVSCELPPNYSSRFVEACWYQWWEKQGYFEPSEVSKRKKSDVFSMVIPPPNVTGKLHLGHALTVALEDVMCRWNRMHGKEVVWVPGCDHAGIATQVVVERLLAAKNTSRHHLGRIKFLEEVWKWKDQKENEIYNQLRILGASLDWRRQNFTLSSKFSHAVREAFIRLHDQDIIYRKKSLINWSCQLQSAISDIEIDNKVANGPTQLTVPGYNKRIEFGVLHTFTYPLVNPVEERTSIEVSTTRIETMLGDTAIAVNPEDSRFSSLVGSHAQHPLLPGVTLPIIADMHVDAQFGTGAVKITPANDYHDFEIGQRHDLPSVDILDDNGNIANTGNSDFDGLPRFSAREKIIDALHQAGLYRGKKAHEMTLPLCSRSGDIVEPRIKTQWFVRTQDLSQKALDAVKTGQIKIEPDSHLSAWNNWLLNNEDWCISRQLWWGHRIPAYHIWTENGKSGWFSGQTEEEAIQKAIKVLQEPKESLKFVQDEDVLDTWFSSAIFPFAALGWPKDSEDLQRYYPLSLMETGYDLLFFWVARMAMMGIALTGKAPFKTVYLHNMVRDSQGRKMSKSLGNVIDPLQVIQGCSPEELDLRIKSSNLTKKEENYALRDRKKTLPHGIPECGTDALRFYLCLNKKSGRDISLDVHSVVQYRFFCNKMWNAFKFLQANVKNQDKNEFQAVGKVAELRPVDNWIRSKISSLAQTTNEALESLNFASAAGNLHKFFIVDFADFYLESCKSIFNDTSVEAHVRKHAIQENFEFVFDTFLRLLSPFMPYITEELWQRLPNRDKQLPSVTIADYPSDTTHHFHDLALERDIDAVRSTIQMIRNIRQMFQVFSQRANILIVCVDTDALDALSHNQDVIRDLTKSARISFSSWHDELHPDGAVGYAVPKTTIKVFVQLKGLIDVESQFHAIRKKADSLKKNLCEVETRLKKAKSEKLQQKLKEKMEKNQKKISELDSVISNLEQLK